MKKENYQNIKEFLQYFRPLSTEEYEFICYNNITSSLIKDVILTYFLFNYGDNLLPLLYFIRPYTSKDTIYTGQARFRNKTYNICVDNEYIKDIALSDLCVNSYYDLLIQEGIETSKNLIKKEIIKLLNGESIYYDYLPLKNYGLTLYSGKIVIVEQIIQDLGTKIQANALLLVTILHEITHYLKRKLNKKDSNYFNNTIPDQNDYVDIGDRFDSLIFEERKEFFISTSLFILDKKSYELSLEKFHEKLADFENELTIEEKIKEAYGLIEYENHIVERICAFHG